MKKLSLYILIIVIVISGCTNAGNINNTKEPQNTQTDITQTPGKETLGPTEPVTPNSPTKTPEPPLPTDSTKTPEPVIPPWFEDKPDYAIDLSNYDINGDKEKYLLQVKFEYLIGECTFDSTNYFVDVNEINKLEGYYEITGRSIIPEELEPYVHKISEDGKKVLLLYPDKNESTIEIFNIINRKILYQYKINKEILGVGATSDLEYLLIFGFGKMILLDVAGDTQKEIDYSADIISPDGTKAVMHNPLEGGNITLKIYDLINEKIIDEINTGTEHVNVFQWHESGKILFHTFEGSFYYDLNTKEIKLIAPYFYYPVMSPDGKYVALTRDDNYGILDYTEIVEHGLYRQYGYNIRLYIKDMISDGIVQIAPFLEFEYGLYNQIPVQWVYVNKEFDNNNNRYCFSSNNVSNYIVYCSSEKKVTVLKTFLIRMLILRVENEEYYNEEEGQENKYDGKGIGEWIKFTNILRQKSII